MNHITLFGITYGIEPDCYNGDLLLLSPAQDVCIEGGYEELKQNARVECSYLDDISGEIECEQRDIDFYIEQHIEDYIRENFPKGIVTPFLTYITARNGNCSGLFSMLSSVGRSYNEAITRKKI